MKALRLIPALALIWAVCASASDNASAANWSSLPAAAQAKIAAALGPTAAVQLAKLTASDGTSGDAFGVSVSISGNVIVAGTFANVAYVFVKPPSGWQDMTQTARLTPSDSGGGFGVSVAVSGSVIVVGAELANQNHGAAYIFVRPSNGWRDMTQTAKLIASDGAVGDAFGSSVAVSGSTVVVGAFSSMVNGNFGQGAAYVFTRPVGGWASVKRAKLTETAKLTASDGGVGDNFGLSVSMSGNVVTVGAFAANQRKGEAYVFVKPVNGWVSMTETARLTPSDSGGGVGQCVATNGSVVAAGSSKNAGVIYVFVAPTSGWVNTTETAQLSGALLGWNFGQSVTIDSTGRVIVTGAPQGNGQQNGAGEVFVYIAPPSGWQTTSQYTLRLFASDGIFGDTFGGSVSISGTTLVVGAQAAVGTQGAAYVFAPQ